MAMAKEEVTQIVENPQLEIIKGGGTLVKMENNTQMAIAVQRPRDESAILKESLRELDLYPSMAREAIYVKPVGKDDKGEQKHAEGLSVRAAESLGNRWNNSSYGVEIVGEDDDSATIAAVFLDYEKNTRHVAMQRVSKFYTTRDKKVIRTTPDRFDLILKANSSKNLREIILRSLPAGLKKEYETKARSILKKEPIAAQRTAMVERLADAGITQEQLEAWKKKPVKEFKKEEVLEALGILNAIRDGEITKESVFGEQKTNGKKDPEQEQPGLKMKGEQKEIDCPELNRRIGEKACEACHQRQGCPSHPAQ